MKKITLLWRYLNSTPTCGLNPLYIFGHQSHGRNVNTTFKRSKTHVARDGSSFFNFASNLGLHSSQPPTQDAGSKDMQLNLQKVEKDLRTLCSIGNLKAASSQLSEVTKHLLKHPKGSIAAKDTSLLTLGFTHVLESCVALKEGKLAYLHVDQAFQLHLQLTTTTYDNVFQLLSELGDLENCSNLLAWLSARTLTPGTHAAMAHLVRTGQRYNHDALWGALQLMETETVLGAYLLFTEAAATGEIEELEAVEDLDLGKMMFIGDELEHYLKSKGVQVPSFTQDVQVQFGESVTSESPEQEMLKELEDSEDWEMPIDFPMEFDEEGALEHLSNPSAPSLNESFVEAESGEPTFLDMDSPSRTVSDLTSQLSHLYPFSKIYFYDWQGDSELENDQPPKLIQVVYEVPPNDN
mmetsp:Transcript_28617/g.37494  ORF Transcript_28617/g.37494 Transcript_28617/m.37494 type:complete len:409 (-) Transcript_28617:190-1416(-)